MVPSTGTDGKRGMLQLQLDEVMIDGRDSSRQLHGCMARDVREESHSREYIYIK